MNITVDGHAASGKSVIAREVAKALNFKVFDTGALYRAVACWWQEQNLGDVNLDKVQKFVKNLKIEVKFMPDGQHTFANGKDFTKHLRTEQISNLSAQISPYVEVRKLVRSIQRDFAAKNDCVMEGRDIGTEVLPNAEVKFFVTASVEIRAERRYLQLKASQPDVSFQEVLADLKKRDYLDETRKIAPLKPAKDSIIIDTGGKQVPESIAECLSYVRKKMK